MMILKATSFFYEHLYDIYLELRMKINQFVRQYTQYSLGLAQSEFELDIYRRNSLVIVETRSISKQYIPDSLDKTQ
jgi:hypothetical protein